MLLHTIYPSHVFTHFSDPSPTLRKSENVSSILINIPTHIKKNRSNLNSIFTIRCFQKSTQEEEEAAKDKKLALAEWLSNTKKAAGDTSSSPAPPFKSTGTPSAPSRPNINSKYSPFSPSTPRSHDRPQKPSKLREPASWRPKNLNPKAAASATLEDDGREVVFGDNGLAYRLAEAPFEFQYSYTETPKVKPLALREAAFVPFGPTTMPRPWTGRAPLPPSKKKPREFDSFKLPPPNKKGVKHIQPPGPFLEGQGPKYVKTREEVLGERLTREEVKQLVQSSCHGSRQLNIGRDGLTHNMLENIHDHWKRRRVCKIKCKGVATVDMDNICNQLEEKTGGKVIHRAGGAVYLFRGRNYNYKTRPVFPMMLWKPVSAVYPRLIERAPGGLTVEEANEFRKKGRSLLPVCKLAKNGVYWNLVKDVRDAFEVCDLARIDCQGLNPSDYRKIGAKLKDLVPCVLLSFELEHILMWRGKDWKPNEPGVGPPEAHSDRECSVADSVKDITRYTLMTTLPIDEKSASEHPVSEYALTKENVLESNSMASENIAHEVLGDKDRITTDLEKSSELQHLVKHADDTMVVKLVSKYALAKENVLESNFMPSRNVADEALGDKDRITSKLEKSTGLRRLLKNADDTMVVKLVSEYAPDKENVLESNNMPSANVADEALGDKDRITTDLEKSARLQCLVKNADDTNGGEVGSLEDKLGMSRSSEVELEELIESNEKIFSDGELTSDISVSATNSDPQCLVDDSANISQTSSSSNVELEEIVESSEATVFSNGGGDSSVSVLASNTDDQCLGEDSAYNSRASDVTFFYGGEDAAISASKQLSEDFNALSKIVDDVSYHHADLTSDSSKRLTESFFTAAETSMVDEELVESTDKDSNLYSQEESRLCAQTQYAEETNGQENDDKFIDTDGNEFIANTTSETSQRGVGFHIDVLWAQAIDSGRVLLLDKSALDPDIVHEKAISFAKNAPLGPFFKRRFSHKKVVKKPWKKNSLVKTNESEGQKSAQRNLNNGRGEISHSSDDLPSGGLPIDELARLLAQ